MENSSQAEIGFMREIIERIFNHMKDYPKAKELWEKDSFAPFLADMDSEPRVVASAMAMSRLPFATKEASELLMEEYDKIYGDSFYGSAIAYFDDESIPEEHKKLKEAFSDYGAADSTEKRKTLDELSSPLFKILDEWTRDCMNGDTLGGCYGRHCLTARFEGDRFSLCYNMDSNDDSGSCAVTSKENDIPLVERSYSQDEIAAIYNDKSRLDTEINGIFEEAGQNFGNAIRIQIEQREQKVSSGQRLD